jgi:transcriptional regulator with XRE-family HTH domain
MQVSPWRIGAYVRKLRLERGLTQRQLAHLAGEPFDEREIHRLERGIFGGVRPDRLQQVLAVLQSDLSALYRWSLLAEEMSPLTLEWQRELPVSNGLDPVTAPVQEVTRARQRLRDALLASRLTCERTRELMAVSQSVLDWRPETPASGLSGQY